MNVIKKAFFSMGVSVFIIAVFSLVYTLNLSFASWFWNHYAFAAFCMALFLLPFLYGLVFLISKKTGTFFASPSMAFFLFAIYFYWSFTMENFLEPLMLVLVALGFFVVFFHEKFMSTVREELE